MTENMYENGKIYKIVDVGYNMCYYGSTVQSLANRMAGHRINYSGYLLNKDTRRQCTVVQIFDTYGIDNCKIELIELYPCTNKMELRRKEGEYIKNNLCVNKNIAGRTTKEYWIDNKEKMLSKNREWVDNNRERRKEYKQVKDKEYRETHREELLQKKKADYLRNKERYNAKGAEYRKDHAEEIKEWKK